MTVGPVHHVVVNVSSLERSIAFYRDLLGYRVSVQGSFDGDAHERSFRLPRGFHGRSASVHPSGARTGIVELVEWTLPHQVARTGPKQAGDHPGVWALAFEVEAGELGRLRDRLIAADVPVYSEPVTHDIDDFGTIAWFAAEDPDGMLLEFMELPTRTDVLARRNSTEE